MSVEVPPSAEFWRLFAVYVHKTCDNLDTQDVSIVESRVLPLLEQYHFLENCRDLGALESILRSLKSVGYVLPLQTVKLLSIEILKEALCQSPEVNASENSNIGVSPYPGIDAAVEFSKCALDCNFYTLRESIDAAVSEVKDLPEAKIDSFDLQNKLCLLEESLCWNICEENHLLQYVLERERRNNNDEQNSTDDAMDMTEERSRLAGFIRRGLQSQSAETRLQALKLAVACSFHSQIAFMKLYPLFRISLYLEDFNCRQYVLAALMDMVYMHHRNLTFSEIAGVILPFLYAPTVNLQLISIIGCGRLLLFDCFPEDTECLLSAMMERYVYHLSSPAGNADSNKMCNINLDTVRNVMQNFFQEYCGEKKQLHQDEIANTVVYMCLEKLEQGIVLIIETGKVHRVHLQQQQMMDVDCDTDVEMDLGMDGTAIELRLADNPMRSEEARRLHLALHLGLSMINISTCSSVSSQLDVVLDSLVLNINEERRADTTRFSALTKDACRSWLLS